MDRRPFLQIVEVHGISWILAALLGAITQFRMIVTIIGADYGDSIAAAQGVVAGTPHWQVYQSRVLGPWVAQFLSGPVGSFHAAHVLYTIGLYFAAGLTMLVTAYRLYGVTAAWIAFLCFHLLCMVLINSRWHYIWDGGDLLSFTLFCYFVLADKDWRWMTGLFCVSILNRESAFFIAAWMILYPFLVAILDRARPRLPMALAGMACLVAGALLVQGLRVVLLHREIGPSLFGMPEMAGRSFHPHLHDNMIYLFDAIRHPTMEFNILIVVLLPAPLVLTGLLARRFGRRYLGLGLAHSLIVLSLPIVGVLSETRVLFDLVPFMAIGFAALIQGQEKPA
ncbi:MAG: hypothetical protein ACOVN0_10345 [Niveispirillum sp.]|uniref:hypothetical protein n=1 Tax=Niveispirillum sp. TaxID=1917217 RepID=UPI003BA414CD